VLIYTHTGLTAKILFMIPCSKLCPRTKPQTMACYTIIVFTLKLATYGWDKIPAFKLKNKKPDTLVTTACTKSMLLRCRAEWVQTISNLHKGYVPETVHNLQYTEVGTDFSPTHLSHLICYVYIFTVSVCTFMMLFLSAFLYETHKIKYIFPITVLKISNTLHYI